MNFYLKMKNKHYPVALFFLILMQTTFNVFAQGTEPEIALVETPTEASLRGLHALSENVVWASGAGGAFLRSIDGGITWKHGIIVDSVDFRDIHAFDENNAVVISAGAPALIFRTTDAGTSWELTYQNDDERAFFDAIDFWDNLNGIAFSDAIEGKFLMIITKDGGNSWMELESAPEALEGEGGFAASGTNMIIAPWGDILLGTTDGRLIISDDFGMTWTYSQSLLESSEPTSGIFSLAAYEENAIMVGGDFANPTIKEKNAASMKSFGEWELCQTSPGGYRSGVAFVPGGSIAICTGPGGSDISFDSGKNWRSLSDAGFHAVSFGSDLNSGWMSGSEGRIAKILWR